MKPSTTVITQKKRGPKPTGKGTLVGVRLQPDLLTILDQWAADTETSRPEALRHAFAQWAESASFTKPHPRTREDPVMIFLQKSDRKKLIEATGHDDIDEAVNVAIREWLAQRGSTE